MEGPPASKLGLSVEEVGAIHLRLARGGWNAVLLEPPVSTVSGKLQIIHDPSMVKYAGPTQSTQSTQSTSASSSNVHERYVSCAWTLAAPCITDRYPEASNDQFLHTRRFLRAYGCARALEGISRIIPNFSYIAQTSGNGTGMPPVESYAEFVENGRTVVADIAHVKLQFSHAPTRVAAHVSMQAPAHTPISQQQSAASYATYAKLLGTPIAPLFEVVTTYLQVVLAVVSANTHVRFAHNRLFACNVLLSKHAKLFSVNYDEISLLCTNYVAILVNYDHSQYSYVRDGGVVFDVIPEIGEQSAVNLDPHFSSDVYTFTKNCYDLCVALASGFARTSPESIHVCERTAFFREMLSFFMSPMPADSSRWPINIPPEGHGREAYLEFLRIKIKERGFNIMRPTYKFRTNIHLRDASSMESTWYACDPRSLVAFREPAEEMLGEVGISQNDDTHTEFFCSQACDAAIARVMSAVISGNDPTRQDFECALEEIPTLLLISARTRARILAMPTPRAVYEAFVTDFMNHQIYAHPRNGFTVADYLHHA